METTSETFAAVEESLMDPDLDAVEQEIALRNFETRERIIELRNHAFGEALGLIRP